MGGALAGGYDWPGEQASSLLTLYSAGSGLVSTVSRLQPKASGKNSVLVLVAWA